jgi:multidrug resistance protein, MATE family
MESSTQPGIMRLFKDPEFRFRVWDEASFTLRLGAPIIAAQLLQMSMGFVDTVMAGRLSASDLAAVAIGSSMLAPLFMLCYGILMGLNPIVAQAFGARDFPMIAKNLRQGLWLSQMLAVLSIILMFQFHYAIDYIGAEPEVADKAIRYVIAMTWGMPFYMAFIVLRVFNESIGATQPGMWIALLGLPFNIFGNWVLVYGKLGFPQLGAVGTGYASAVVGLVMFVSILIYTLRNKAYKRFEIFKNWRLPEWRYQKELLRIGVPSGISSFMEVSMFATIALLVGTLGTIAMAGHQVALNVGSITFMIPFGLATAISVRVGVFVGRNQPDRARFAGYTGIGLSVMIMMMTASVMLLFPKTIVSMYTTDVEVVELAARLLIMAAIFQISDGLQVSGLGALRGLKDTRIPMFVNIVAYWGIGLPIGYWAGLVKGWGPEGFWIGLIFGLSAAAVMHNIRFRYLSNRIQ